MPYIQCEDGKTYSRYDQSPYVRECIVKEREYYRNRELNCQADPVCHQRQLDKSHAVDVFIISMIFTLVFFGVATYKNGRTSYIFAGLGLVSFVYGVIYLFS